MIRKMLALLLVSSLSFAQVADKGSTFEIGQTPVIASAGESKIIMDKAKPRVVLSKWNGEAALGVHYKDIAATATTSAETVKWGSGAKEVHAYALPAGKGMEDGGLEMEIVLNSPPLTNVFPFFIDGAENLGFYYQPELTQSEIDSGAERPENVIGSYAVYHKTKANHRIGSINYGTGKAFHIYRPKAIDANGVETWAELSYADGVLTVMVPQKFLDDAVYPVRVDPTFGYTGTGASTANLENIYTGARYAISEDGTGSSITAILDVATAAHLTKCNVYQDEGGVSDLTVAALANGQTEEKSVGIADDQSVTFNFNSAPSFTSGTYYRLTIWSQSTTGTARLNYDASISGEIFFYKTAATYGTWPDPAVYSGSNVDCRASIYATYTASGGGGGAIPDNPRRVIVTED